MSTQFILTEDPHRRVIAWWLVVVSVLVLAMIMLGGATRLTQSGLSIVEWKPLSGAIPPMNIEEWMAEFNAYRQYPEYLLVNKGMSLDEFKSIFWWEYSHRLLGRLIGLVFAVPLLFFVAKRMVPSDYKMKLFGLLALGGAQGAMGWWMVMSGLVNEPDVSQYRLAAHLGLALIILCYSLWLALGLLRPDVGENRGWGHLPVVIFAVTFLQMMLGALVAGLDAGFAYNTWPDMDGSFLPSEAFHIEPLWHNFTENTAMVQFWHRMTAYTVLGLVVFAFIKGKRMGAGGDVKRALLLMKALTGFQVVLGIATLLMVVPVSLGVLHQGFAVLVLASTLYFVFETKVSRS